ncbi:MAG: heme ABC exporter ATP-binding protein CcmA [Actinomycetota bacterium]
MNLVEVSGLRVDLGRHIVLAGVDLRLAQGERLGVSGPNGAGKTTLLAVLATLRAPISGSVRVLGADPATDAVRAIRPRIGWSGHHPALYDDLTLSENLRHFSRLAGRGDTPADEALSQVGLAGAAHRLARECSNGMRRRADLARLLLLRPRLLLLDEAHAGLDPDALVIIRALMDRTVADGGGVVMVSHDARALSGYVDRTIVLDRGEVRR